MRIGSFVNVPSTDFGLGKITKFSGSQVTISYFSSPIGDECHRQVFGKSEVKKQILQAQTRVYWYDEENRSWLVGRIAEDGRIDANHAGLEEDYYFIHLPNQKYARIPESKLYVRWNRPIEDPVSCLAARTTETPFWHLGRQQFLWNVAEQRAVCGSLTALWSAAIQLEIHQFRAVRTVLRDPIQRYLLADEVGLGKTIEAGAILRQFVMDNPHSHRVLIVVPPHLVLQWKEELETRFYLGPQLVEDSVQVVPETNINTLEHGPDGLGMLVVDEAHRLASMAFSSDPLQQQYYKLIEKLAYKAQRLLLLSATPVLRNEDGYLAMLHLLDPEAYKIDDQEAFHRRLKNRQQLAESLSDLRTDSLPVFVEDALNSLSPLTADDPRATRLIDRVRQYADLDEDNENRKRAILELREHISEVYRLHRRMIRHRRETVTDVLFGRAGLSVLSISDPLRKRMGELLELWRDHANLSAPQGSPRHNEVAELYWLLLQGASSHPMVLRALIEARRFNQEPPGDLIPLYGSDFSILNSGWVFPKEREILDDFLAVEGVNNFSRLEVLVDTVQSAHTNGLKTVLFCDASRVADKLAAALALRIGKGVMRHGKDEQLGAFLNTDGSAIVLVCDRCAEEGLNLQNVKAQIVHFDLPLDPGRIEQRMGRIDRFGARAPVTSVVFADQDDISEAWRHCLNDVIRVFERSIASLQYILEEQFIKLRQSAFAGGTEAIENLTASLRDADNGLEAELRRIRTQEQIDALGEPTHLDTSEFETLDDFDLEHKLFRRSFDSWVERRLQFKREEQAQGGSVVRYRYKLHGRHQTLITPDQFIHWCRTSVDDNADSSEKGPVTHPFAFSRNQALWKNAQLLRVGHPFVDGLIELTRRDDRGVAHMMWRQRSFAELPEDPWLVFGFDYLIEADPATVPIPDLLVAGCDMAAVRRRLDEFLPPLYATVWLDGELEVVEDKALISILSEPYENKWNHRGCDWHLSASRWESIEQLVNVHSWEELCFNASKRSLELMKERLGLNDAFRDAEIRLEKRLDLVRGQLNARLSRFPAEAANTERHVLEMEEAFTDLARRTLRNPRVTPDSAFALFLSTTNPFDVEY